MHYELLSTARKQELDSLRASHLTYRLHPVSLVGTTLWFVMHILSASCAHIFAHYIRLTISSLFQFQSADIGKETHVEAYFGH